jgi:hypothetical protein
MDEELDPEEMFHPPETLPPKDDPAASMVQQYIVNAGAPSFQGVGAPTQADVNTTLDEPTLENAYAFNKQFGDTIQAPALDPRKNARIFAPMVESGKRLLDNIRTVQDFTGLRREDYTDDPTAAQPVDRNIATAQQLTDLGFGVGMARGAIRGMDPSSLGIFGSAKHDFPNMVMQAEAMERAGASPQEIWKRLTVNPASGVFRDAARDWRYRIPDKDSWMQPVLDPQVVAIHRKTDPTLSSRVRDTRPETLSQNFSHPELEKVYPDVKKVRVQHTEEPTYAGASFPPKQPPIMALPKSSTLATEAQRLAEERDLVLHELQHMVSKKHNLSRGGNPDEFYPVRVFRTHDDEFKGHQSYERLTDEVLARLTQEEKDMVFSKLRERFPPDYYAHSRELGGGPIPAENQIVLKQRQKATRNR